jgi:hypothetical protein
MMIEPFLFGGPPLSLLYQIVFLEEKYTLSDGAVTPIGKEKEEGLVWNRHTPSKGSALKQKIRLLFSSFEKGTQNVSSCTMMHHIPVFLLSIILPHRPIHPFPLAYFEQI